MKRFVCGLLMTAAFAAPAAIPSAAMAKTCSAGYTHAVIGGQQKCLRAGEYCARRYQKQYLHYHYTCNHYVSGRWHLRRRS